MDTNEVEGEAKGVLGKVQDAVGSVLGDTPAQWSGKIKELSGKTQEVYGQAAEQLRQTTKENPLVTLAAIGLAGFLLGALWASSGSNEPDYTESYRRPRRRYS